MTRPQRSKIGYCDYSGGDLNFVIRGSVKGDCEQSPGCEHCWARVLGERFGILPEHTTVYPEKLERLRNWKPKPPWKRGPGSRPMAFPVDMGDLFHEDVPQEFIHHAFNVMADRADIDWQVLTKRAERMEKELLDWCGAPNIWLIVSVESPDYLWRIDDLLNTPAGLRGVSLEPMLGPIDISPWIRPNVFAQSSTHFERTGHQRLSVDLMAYDSPGGILGYCQDCGAKFINPDATLDWVIVGAESGPKRRPFKNEWARDVLDQCRAAGVPFFGKQGSGVRPGVPLLDREGRRVEEWPS